MVGSSVNECKYFVFLCGREERGGGGGAGSLAGVSNILVFFTTIALETRNLAVTLTPTHAKYRDEKCPPDGVTGVK